MVPFLYQAGVLIAMVSCTTTKPAEKVTQRQKP